MRRSKSDPSKYASNYRKISQRHMTGYDDDGGGDGIVVDNNDDDDDGRVRSAEAEERRRLETIMRQSESTWRRGLEQRGKNSGNDGGMKEIGKVGTNDDRHDDDDAEVKGERYNNNDDNNKRRGRGRGAKGDSTNEDEYDYDEVNNNNDDDDMLSLLSPELRAQFSGMGNDAIVVLPGRRKRKPREGRRDPPPLSPLEIKAAKAAYKNARRKLVQLDMRKNAKETRNRLYRELEENALIRRSKGSDSNDDGIDNDATWTASSRITTNNPTIDVERAARGLLLKSSELGKKLTRRERLKRLRRREAMGIPLTREEMDVLYVEHDAPDLDSFPYRETRTTKRACVGGDESKYEITVDEDYDDHVDVERVPFAKGKREANNDSIRKVDNGGDVRSSGTLEVTVLPDETIPVPSAVAASIAPKSNADDDDIVERPINQPFSQMMFAGLSKLKAKTDARNAELTIEMARKRAEEEEMANRLEEEERKQRNVYVPSHEPITVSTMHHLFDDVNKSSDDIVQKRNMIVQRIDRPASIEESRYDLPVSSMEYEIIDAVRSNDCTILCGETGSGKSTQVPQFLYEAGFSTSSWWQVLHRRSNSLGGGNDDCGELKSSHLLIGITQPRRVAAVSTAKRVCFEMGCGDGQKISNDNLVAYQTRYETAGLGKSTRVKFMTDGILLQEIQSDLLLRKYGAIVIDEAHERNLNTDVLLGLLSLALPMRRKAAEEGSLPPLKLVIMSATLRVEDFVNNDRLFPERAGGGKDGAIERPSSKPALVTVPGRTHPVSIHHSKVTELDDYERAAIEKTCKIHRKLPAGGILVFLTGKQEIIRCVNRLKQRLDPSNRERKISNNAGSSKDRLIGRNDVRRLPINVNDDALDGFRDMDDDEVDGDLFQKEEDEDDYGGQTDDVDAEVDLVIPACDNNDSRPNKVLILPLYSMLSADEQAKVFSPVPEDTRLIVIATNIAETSITIPGISYVVDCGRQKCRNYHAGTGVASYDVMWISKAAADQRAGRAGRTGPGHCYRLYSSSVYSRYLDDFALPEVLTRPLEDIVLAMKAMHVSNVTSFPFPTSPEQSQINAAVRLLANLGCLDISRVEEHGGDGKITPLGAATAQLPLGVRYGKMLLVGAQANVLDYAIALVAVLSESTPFVFNAERIDKDASELDQYMDLDNFDRNQTLQREEEGKHDMKSKWFHDGGDVLAALMAVGAYSYAGRGAGGISERLASRQFCEKNGLHLVVMQRIAKMRQHLCKLAKSRLPHAGGIAAETGKYLSSMPPPTRTQMCLLRQVIASGLLDNIARRAPPGLLTMEFSGISRSAYICGNSLMKEPLFIDNNSTVHLLRPEWVCFDSIVRKTKKDGTSIATMQKVTPIDVEWIASVCHGSNMITLGSPLASPSPRYIKEKDSIQCAVETKFWGHGWEISPLYVSMYDMIQKQSDSDKRKQTSAVMRDDSYRWFARYLLEGKVLPELAGLLLMLNDEPAIITRRKPMKKVMVFVSTLSDAGVDSAAALQKHWAEKDDKFLFKALKPWVISNNAEKVKQLWIAAVTSNVEVWRRRIKFA
ncbi:hypothetical protein ACHAXA_005455 [Cyclostephanos tholiformis]|uniref:Uncharacterized protein n=1 Tax=Cyclostephanos tholiformis TaxID=382380 RepID=A0ABD3SHW5_9STRA